MFALAVRIQIVFVHKDLVTVFTFHLPFFRVTEAVFIETSEMFEYFVAFFAFEHLGGLVQGSKKNDFRDGKQKTFQKQTAFHYKTKKKQEIVYFK